MDNKEKQLKCNVLQLLHIDLVMDSQIGMTKCRTDGVMKYLIKF